MAEVGREDPRPLVAIAFRRRVDCALADGRHVALRRGAGESGQQVYAIEATSLGVTERIVLTDEAMEELARAYAVLEGDRANPVLGEAFVAHIRIAD